MNSLPFEVCDDGSVHMRRLKAMNLWAHPWAVDGSRGSISCNVWSSDRPSLKGTTGDAMQTASHFFMLQYNQILKADWHKSWLYCAATWWCVQFKPKRCSVLECLPRMWYPHGQCHRWCCWQKRIAWPDTLKLKFWSTLNTSFVGGDWLMKGPSKSDAAHSWMCSTAPTEHTELCRTSLPSIWTQRGIC